MNNLKYFCIIILSVFMISCKHEIEEMPNSEPQTTYDPKDKPADEHSDKSSDSHEEETNTNNQQDNHSDDNPSETPTIKTEIDKDFCYSFYRKIQGEDFDTGCLYFIQNYGDDFESAYETLKPEIDLLRERFNKDQQQTGNKYNVSERLNTITVTNSPNQNLVYTSIDYYVYSDIYKHEIKINAYGVIDSEGNFYGIQYPED